MTELKKRVLEDNVANITRMRNITSHPFYRMITLVRTWEMGSSPWNSKVKKQKMKRIAS